MKLSTYLKTLIRNNVEEENLNDSQTRFIELFDIAHKKAYDIKHKELKVLLNRLSINLSQVINSLDIFYRYVKIPQEKQEISKPLFKHPINDIALEIALKDLRNNKGNNTYND